MAVIARNEAIPSSVVVSGKPITRVIPEEIDGYPITTLGYDIRVLALQIYEKFFI